MSFPHSLRDRKIAGKLLWLAAACTSTCMPAASAQQVGARFALGPEKVRLAMERLQLPTVGVEVKLAAPVTSSSPQSRLEIQSLALLGPHQLRMRVSCSDRSECLPFFAIATYPDAIDPASLPAKLDRVDGPEHAAQSAKGPGTSAPANTPLVRSGSLATLDMDSDKVHVRLDVVCLDSGTAGNKVRVTTRDRKQVYVAEVVTSTLLKGNF